jgi:hypothetical protein
MANSGVEAVKVAEHVVASGTPTGETGGMGMRERSSMDTVESRHW